MTNILIHILPITTAEISSHIFKIDLLKFYLKYFFKFQDKFIMLFLILFERRLIHRDLYYLINKDSNLYMDIILCVWVFGVYVRARMYIRCMYDVFIMCICNVFKINCLFDKLFLLL